MLTNYFATGFKQLSNFMAIGVRHLQWHSDVPSCGRISPGCCPCHTRDMTMVRGKTGVEAACHRRRGCVASPTGPDPFAAVAVVCRLRIEALAHSPRPDTIPHSHKRDIKELASQKCPWTAYTIVCTWELSCMISLETTVLEGPEEPRNPFGHVPTERPRHKEVSRAQHAVRTTHCVPSERAVLRCCLRLSSSIKTPCPPTIVKAGFPISLLSAWNNEKDCAPGCYAHRHRIEDGCDMSSRRGPAPQWPDRPVIVQG